MLNASSLVVMLEAANELMCALQDLNLTISVDEINRTLTGFYYWNCHNYLLGYRKNLQFYQVEARALLRHPLPIRNEHKK